MKRLFPVDWSGTLFGVELHVDSSLYFANTMMDQQTQPLGISRAAVGVLVVFAVTATTLVMAGAGDFPGLHTVLDTGIFMLSCLLALLLWEIGLHSAIQFPKAIALSFALTSLLESIHAFVSIEWHGALAVLTQSVDTLRPSTWPPPAYLLPIGISCSLWLMHRQGQSALRFGIALFALCVIFFITFHWLPVYTSPSWLNITRPFLVPVSLLWAVVGWLCWKLYRSDRLAPKLAVMAIILFFSNVAMLYSRSPHDTPAMLAHLGKIGGYLFFLMSLMQLASSDMQERIRAENKFRNLLEAAPDATVVVNSHGKIVLINDQVQKLFGYAREEIMDQTIELLIPPRFRNRHPEHRAGFLAEAKARPMGAGSELFGLHKSGHEFPVEISLSPLLTDEGTLVSGAIRDITDHKRREEQLRLQAIALQQQASLLDVAHDSIVVRNLAGIISFWNKGAQATYGWTKEEAIGQVSHELLHTTFAQPLDKINALLLEQERWEGELGHTKQNGSQIVVASRWVLQRDDKGEPATVLEINNDITTRKRAEEALQGQAAELADANKELEAFTYSIAHDLRAPLRHVQGFSRALMEDFAPEITPAAQECVQDIVEGTQRMSLLVDDLLALARVGRQELNVGATSLSAVVREALKDLENDTKDRDIQWQVSELPFVDCDRRLMKQVFFNLLSNAVKYTRPRKPAIVEVGQLEVDGQLVIFVRDNGVGFSMKYADKLFGVFQRLHRSEDFEGTGVGLATVQRILHKHSGRIWAEAELDKGATFYFSLSSSTKGSDQAAKTVGAQ